MIDNFKDCKTMVELMRAMGMPDRAEVNPLRYKAQGKKLWKLEKGDTIYEFLECADESIEDLKIYDKEPTNGME